MAAATSTRKARILVVDDHPMLRAGLIRLIEQNGDLMCCGEAGTVAEAQAAVATHKPDLVILDLRLKGGDGLELIKSLKTQVPDLRILILSQCEAQLYAERALRAGALGYLVKEQAPDEVVSAIRTVLGGEIYVSREVAGRLLHKLVRAAGQTGRTGIEKLTNRELHVLQLLGAGLSTRAIAMELKLNFKTVETHRENLKHKLGLRDAAALVHYASEWAREQVTLPPKSLQDGTGPVVC